MPPDECAGLPEFVRGERDAADFPHREHVRMGFEMLRRHDFLTSVQHYSQALRIMTARAGHPQAFNQTLTIAFLSLIAERMQQRPEADFSTLMSAFPELLDKHHLARWYSRERLQCEAARDSFLLPDQLP
jgi:hypothetical protein